MCRHRSYEATRPEIQLLLDAAWVGSLAETTEQSKALLQQPLEWEYLLGVAKQHRMLLMLYELLKTADTSPVPQPVLAWLQRYARNHSRRNLVLTGELLQLIKLFSRHGIPVVPLKGPLLSEVAYGNLALREYCDLDVLIRDQDVPKACELLVSMGYRAKYHLNIAQLSPFLNYQYHLLFSRQDGIVVEIHWRLTERYFSVPLDPRKLWQRLVPIRFRNQEILTLCQEDLLLFLCVHGGKHCWRQLTWICDIARLVVVCPGVNWSVIKQRACGLGSTRLLRLGLFLASDLLGVSLPAQLWQWVCADVEVELLASQVYGWLFSSLPLVEAGGDWQWQSGLFHLRTRERLRDRVHYCLDLALTPTVSDWEFLRLPPDYSFLYYLLRPVRLGAKYVGKLLRSRPSPLRLENSNTGTNYITQASGR